MPKRARETTTTTTGGAAARSGGNKQLKLTQMYLDAGQKNIGAITCPKCGMVYMRQEADLKEHQRLCSQLQQRKKNTESAQDPLLNAPRCFYTRALDSAGQPPAGEMKVSAGRANVMSLIADITNEPVDSPCPLLAAGKKKSLNSNDGSSGPQQQQGLPQGVARLPFGRQDGLNVIHVSSTFLSETAGSTGRCTNSAAEGSTSCAGTSNEQHRAGVSCWFASLLAQLLLNDPNKVKNSETEKDNAFCTSSAPTTAADVVEGDGKRNTVEYLLMFCEGNPSCQAVVQFRVHTRSLLAEGMLEGEGELLAPSHQRTLVDVDAFWVSSDPLSVVDQVGRRILSESSSEQSEEKKQTPTLSAASSASSSSQRRVFSAKDRDLFEAVLRPTAAANFFVPRDQRQPDWLEQIDREQSKVLTKAERQFVFAKLSMDALSAHAIYGYRLSYAELCISTSTIAPYSDDREGCLVLRRVFEGDAGKRHCAVRTFDP